MTSRWSFAEDQLEVIWQPKAAQDLLWNLIITAIMLMIPCRLPHSCMNRSTVDESVITDKIYGNIAVTPCVLLSILTMAIIFSDVTFMDI